MTLLRPPVDSNTYSLPRARASDFPPYTSSNMVILLRLWMMCGVATALRWRPLTNQEISEWYSPVERCLLNTSDVLLRPLLSLKEHCGYSHRSNCMVGTGHPSSICVGPFSARKSFLYGFDEFASVDVNPALRLIDALSSTNTTLFFIGDSLILQQYQFFVCEILREGGVEYSLPQIVKGNRFDFVSKLVRNVRTNTSVKIHFKRLTIFDDENIKGTFWRKLSEFNRLLLVVNLGLHYHDRHSYRTAVSTFLSFLEKYLDNRGNRVVWLETTDQHFPNEAEQNGYYSLNDTIRHIKELANLQSDELSKADIFQRMCPRFTNTSFEADWRNQIASAAVTEISHPRLSFYSTKHALIDVTDMHAINTIKWLDCTHFCYSPLMWQPEWHYLAALAESMVGTL